MYIVQGRHKGKTYEVWDDISLEDLEACKRFIDDTKVAHREDDRIEYRIVEEVQEWK